MFAMGNLWFMVFLTPRCILFNDFTVFHLPEQQVQILHPVEKLRAGDQIMAIYPDTTSFYHVSIISLVDWFHLYRPNLSLTLFSAFSTYYRLPSSRLPVNRVPEVLLSW